jgi:hypothetical protein
MKCIRCGKENDRKICYACMDSWTEIRSLIFSTLEERHGKLSQINHPIFIKETKRLEKIWRKSKNDFAKEIEKFKFETTERESIKAQISDELKSNGY